MSYAGHLTQKYKPGFNQLIKLFLGVLETSRAEFRHPCSKPIEMSLTVQFTAIVDKITQMGVAGSVWILIFLLISSLVFVQRETLVWINEGLN